MPADIKVTHQPAVKVQTMQLSKGFEDLNITDDANSQLVKRGRKTLVEQLEEKVNKNFKMGSVVPSKQGEHYKMQRPCALNRQQGCYSGEYWSNTTVIYVKKVRIGKKSEIFQSRTNEGDGELEFAVEKKVAVSVSTETSWNVEVSVGTEGIASFKSSLGFSVGTEHTVEETVTDTMKCPANSECGFAMDIYFAIIEGTCKRHEELQCQGLTKENMCTDQSRYEGLCPEGLKVANQGCIKTEEQCDIKLALLDRNGRPFSRVAAYALRLGSNVETISTDL